MARKPFFGSSGAPAIAKMDMRAATEPGRAFGNMFSQLGQIAGVALRKHAENKEKKQNQELLEDFLKRNGYDEEDAKVISKIPEANRLITDMKKFESDMETAETNREYLESQTAINEANIKSAEEAKKEEMEMNRFLVTPSERMPTKSEGRYSVLKNLQEGKGVTPPARMVKEDSVAVSQLPEPYKKFGRDVEKAVQDGDISVNAGAGLIRQKQAEAVALMGEGLQLSPGEKKLDEAFADSLIDFNESDVNKGLQQLNEAVSELGKKDTITGPIVSLMPDFVKSRVNPTATQVQEAVEEVVQRNLRLVLGAQFTEREGERLIKRAFNPALPESENKKRVERLIKSIKTALDEKLRQRSYFSAYGTLKGYRYEPYSYAQLESDMIGDEANPDTAPATQEQMDRIKELEELEKQRRGR